MEAVEEVTWTAIDPIVPNSQEAITGDISPAVDRTQLADNARGVGPNNIQQEDEDLQLIPPNGIPGSVVLGINFNYDVFKHDFLMRDAAWRSNEVRKELRELKEAITMSRQEAEAIARSQKKTTTRLGQSSAGPSNHMEGIDVRRGQPAASLQTKLALMAEYRNTVSRMLEECERAIERNTSLEEELVIAQRKIDELKQRHLKSIFDSYVNPDNNPDVQPLVKSLDAEDFDVDAFLGINMGGRKEEMTSDFLDGLSVHDVRRLESEIENIRREPQRVTGATARLRLNYEQECTSSSNSQREHHRLNRGANCWMLN
ncbi:hypothetical protein R1flu_009448 [Riccia fluitans]|uniref:Uncharacterized protein n=1 Tax=Riccia fluitans TaxID=41844 RepID=A0ABD1Z247_9MARC